MDALVLPIVGESDPPDTAIRQMQQAGVRAVVVENAGAYRILSNEEALDAWARGLPQLGDLRAVGLAGASLAGVGNPVWQVLSRSSGLFSEENRSQTPTVDWDELESWVKPAMDAGLVVPVDYAVLRLEGAAAVVFTRHEPQGDAIRTRRRKCRCGHDSYVVDEQPPSITDGSSCLHGGTYRCV